MGRVFSGNKRYCIQDTFVIGLLFREIEFDEGGRPYPPLYEGTCQVEDLMGLIDNGCVTCRYDSMKSEKDIFRHFRSQGVAGKIFAL